jgi:hypothetical protein
MIVRPLSPGEVPARRGPITPTEKNRRIPCGTVPRLPGLSRMSWAAA